MPNLLSPCIDAADPTVRASVEHTLDRFGPGAARLAHDANMQIVVLGPRERYADRSRALRRLAAGVDEWPLPPAGLFVVEERTVYLRTGWRLDECIHGESSDETG